MAIFKCKMCGGDLNVQQGMTVCECEFCGTTQTIPSADDERKTNLFNRANHLRIKNEFDRALGIYESIIADFPKEAEAYWGILLCKYGIEYVDDPLTNRKIATCHRTSYESILNDENLKLALEFADPVAREIYEKEARYIDEVQKDILKIANNEKSYDVFICYKETDDIGERTHDSVFAQELYDTLTQNGMNVFFSRITLEGKLGKAYEPYIFAALNSAKVMTVIGTKLEYFNAVWVKNEWMRFLELMKKDKSKTLIPVYKELDPHDLPDALSKLQAQDMSKIGFMQDLVRGIKKLVGKDEEKPIVKTIVQQVVSSGTNVENLMQRGKLSLEDGKWSEANEFFEKVLNENVKEARAYFGKLMVDLRYYGEENFKSGRKTFSQNENYRKVLRFGNEEIVKKVKMYNCIAHYNMAMDRTAEADKCSSAVKAFALYNEAKKILDRVDDDYKEVDELKEKCMDAIKELAPKAEEEERRIIKQKEEAQNSAVYNQAENFFAESQYEDAVELYKKLGDYSDAKEKIAII